MIPFPCKFNFLHKCFAPFEWSGITIFFPAIYQLIAHVKKKKKSLWKKAICAGDKSEGSAVILLDCHSSSFEHSNGKLTLATGCTNESLKVQLSYWNNPAKIESIKNLTAKYLSMWAGLRYRWESFTSPVKVVLKRNRNCLNSAVKTNIILAFLTKRSARIVYTGLQCLNRCSNHCFLGTYTYFSSEWYVKRRKQPCRGELNTSTPV